MDIFLVNLYKNRMANDISIYSLSDELYNLKFKKSIDKSTISYLGHGYSTKD